MDDRAGALRGTTRPDAADGGALPGFVAHDGMTAGGEESGVQAERSGKTIRKKKKPGIPPG